MKKNVISKMIYRIEKLLTTDLENNFAELVMGKIETMGPMSIYLYVYIIGHFTLDTCDVLTNLRCIL